MLVLFEVKDLGANKKSGYLIKKTTTNRHTITVRRSQKGAAPKKVEIVNIKLYYFY